MFDKGYVNSPPGPKLKCYPLTPSGDKISEDKPGSNSPDDQTGESNTEDKGSRHPGARTVHAQVCDVQMGYEGGVGRRSGKGGWRERVI